MHVWSIGADGREYAVKDSDMTETWSAADFMLYSDSQVRLAHPPAVDAGAVVALEFERESQPYASDYIWAVQHAIPTRRESLKVTLPEGFTYKTV